MMFELGKIFATQAVYEILSRELISLLLIRYLSGDWGDLCEADKQANENALKNQQRILASYTIEDEKIYIVTEADRSKTTLLFAYEY
ncbi:hypothetical protein ACFGWM_03555 [Pasteurella multocida]